MVRQRTVDQLLIQIDPHQLKSVLSTLNIQIRYDRFEKPCVDSFFELTYQARRIRMAQIQVRNNKDKFLIF